MPADDKPWSTSYPGAQDTVGVEQGDLTNDSAPGMLDGHRALVEHVHALRDKLHAVCLKMGDNSTSSLPVGSVGDILDTDWTDAKQLRLAERTAKPTAAAGKGFIYTKDVGGTTKLFYEDSAGTEQNISEGGGASAFTDLTDAFASYTSKALATLRVKSAEDGLETLKNNLSASLDPTNEDGANDGYDLGSLWIRTDVGNEKVFICIKNTDPDAAIWQEVGSGGGASAFTDLTDAFASYTGRAYGSLRVKSGEDGLETLKHNLTATSDPTVDMGADDGYEVGSQWHRVDATNEKVFICLKNTDPNLAIWQEVGAGGGGASSLDGAYDGGSAITADAGPVTINADNGQALKATSTNGIGTDDALVEVTHTQEADNKSSIKITHDFNSKEGSGIKFSSSNTGDGTASGEQIEFIDAAVLKKVPSETTYFTVTDTGVLRKKTVGGSWSSVTLPGTINNLWGVKGTSLSDVWICGLDSSGVGYIAVDDGGGFDEVISHPTYGTHPMTQGGSGKIMRTVLPISASEVWTNTQDDSSGTYSRIHKWDPTNGWVEKFSISRSGGNSIYRNVVKVGTYLAAPASDKLFYSLNDGEDWFTESTPWSGGAYIDVSPNVSNTKFHVLKKVSGNFVLYEGVPGDPGTWVEVGTYDCGGSGNYPYEYGSLLYTDESGNAFAIINTGSGYGMVYNWDTTPTLVSCSWCRGISGAANVIFVDNNPAGMQTLRIWDGVTLDSDSIGVINNIATWAYTAASEGSQFNVYRGSFTGSTGSNRAVIFKGGSGATHALHADSGAVTLSDMLDPATESGTVSYYSKDVSGTSEAHIKDGAGNVVQVTSGGNVNTSGAIKRREEEFSTTGGETPGVVVALGPLTGTPVAATNMKSGFDLQVFYNGVKMKYRSPAPLAENEYFYDSANKEIDIYATGTIVDYEVVYLE